jgi:outer membrane protein TolC
MKKIVTIATMLLVTKVCLAQLPSDTMALTRDEAIKIGLEKRFDVQANEYDVQIAGSKIRQVKNNRFAAITADAQVQYSPQLRNSVIPGGVLPGFDKTTLLPLMVKNETVFGLTLTQPLFNAGLTKEIQLAKNQLALQKEKNRSASIDIMLQISQAYLNAELRGLQLRVASDIAARNSAYEQIAEGMYRNGSLIENHYLRAKLDRENAEQLQKQAVQNYELSMLQLRYQLNLPEQTRLKLRDSLQTISVAPYVFSEVHGERTELRQLELARQENILTLEKHRQSILPSVSLGAGYAQQFLSDQFNYGSGKWWSPYSYVTLNVHIPVTSHFKNKAVVSEYRQRIIQSDLLLQQKKTDINYEVQQAGTLLSNAILNMQSAQSSYELSRTIFRNQQQQYQLGAFDYSALLDTEKSLSTTERNYIQSAYELVLAQIQLQKATNNLNIIP